MNKKIINCILCMFVGILIGIFLQLTYSFPINFNSQIGLIDILELIITIFLGIYIARIIEKKLQDKRIEKDIFIKNIDQIEYLIQEFEKIEVGDPISYSKITNRISKAREKKNRLLFNIIKKVKPNKIINSQIEDVQIKLKNDFKILKNLLTNTPSQEIDQADVRLINGKITYFDTRLKEIFAVLFDINDKLLELKLIVNSL